MGGGKGGGGSGGADKAAQMQAQLAQQLMAETSPLRNALIGNSMNFLGVKPAPGGRGSFGGTGSRSGGGGLKGGLDFSPLPRARGLKVGDNMPNAGGLGQGYIADPNAKFDLSASPEFAAMKDVTESQFGRAQDSLIANTPEGGPLAAILAQLEGQRASDLVRNTGALSAAEMERAFQLVNTGTGNAIQAGGNAGLIQAQLAQARASESAGKAGALGTGLGSYAGLKAGGFIPKGSTSSITFKDEIGPVTILDKLASIPVNKWRYKGEQEIHIGPYAEDFNGAFGLGDNKYIYFLDFLGVLLGAVKELHEKLEK